MLDRREKSAIVDPDLDMITKGFNTGVLKGVKLPPIEQT